jgi:predicted ATPase/DNA-binding CsgD family transcriptional regulator
LRTRRRALGLTQAELAAQLDVSANTVARWERGEVRIGRPAQVAQILARLERRPAVTETPPGQRQQPRRISRHRQESDLPGGAPPNNLPAQLSTFVGRREQIDQLVQRLQTTRLLTLTGPGGVGKTRLGLQIAAHALPGFRDGAWFVDLATTTADAMVRDTVAAALNIRERRHTDVATLLTASLKSSALLIVLDNCEHVLVGSADIAHFILQACPYVVIVATSREPLGVSGEVTWPVPSLSLHDGDTDDPEEGQITSEAGQLFVQRAQSVQPDFVLSPEISRIVADICRRLDGLPLAIELAAAQTRSVPLRALRHQLEHVGGGLTLLARGPRDAPARQQTLRATLSWSYDLLDAEEQVLFRRLAPFRRCTLDAATAVCGAANEGSQVASVTLDPLVIEVQSGLSSLVNKSLLFVDEDLDGHAWYTMLETVRQFALERLEASPEAGAVWRRYARYYLQLAEQAEPESRTIRQDTLLNRLEREHGNFRIALDWCAAQGYAEAALRMAVGLLWFWGIHGHVGEGRQRLQALLARFPLRETTRKRSVLHARAVDAAGKLAALQGDLEAADSLHQQSLILAEGLEDGEGICNALSALAFAAHERADYASAGDYLERALTTSRRLASDPNAVDVAALWRIGQALVGLANIAEEQGDSQKATRLLQESSTYFMKSGDLGGHAMNDVYVGAMALDAGDPLRARDLARRGVQALERMGDQRAIAMALAHLGRAETALKDFSAAYAHLRRSLRISQEHGDEGGIAFELLCFAGLAAAQGQPVRALRLGGAAVAQRERAEMLIAPASERRFAAQFEPVRKELGRVADTAMAEGRTLSVEAAVAEALATAPSALRELNDLSQREREIATLIARGFSNRRIANELVVGQPTVATHVQHILAKLGLASRAQVAVWVSQQGWLKEPAISKDF